MACERDHGGPGRSVTDPAWPAVQHADAATGWRIWHVNTGDGPVALHPPYGGAPGCVGTQPVTDRTVHAQCIERADHQPPEPGCACGIFAVENVIDALFRLHVITRNIAAGTTSAWRPTRLRPGTIPVLARVHLHRVRWDHDASDVHKCITPEMRAASARIERLYLTDRLVGRDTARRIADQLAAALSVTAVVGYPGYTLDDWQQRPAWYRRGGPQASPGIDDEYLPLFTRSEPLIPFCAPVPKPGQTVWGGYVGRWDGN